MNPIDYQRAAARTLPAGLPDRDRLSMLALGVVGEWAEYEAEEDGDKAANVVELLYSF